MFFLPPFTLGSSSKCFLASLCSRELVKTFFLLPFALGDLSKEFGNCFRFIFSLWCITWWCSYLYGVRDFRVSKVFRGFKDEVEGSNVERLAPIFFYQTVINF